MPFLPADLSVTASTMATSACLPVVMNCLTPLSTQCPPSRTAVVFRADASEPTCGSVRQKQPRASPRASGSEPAVLLSVAAVLQRDAASQRVLHADDRGGGAISRGDFLEREHQAHGVHAGTAPGLGHGHAHGAQAAEFTQHLGGKGLFAVPAGRVRRDAFPAQSCAWRRGSWCVPGSAAWCVSLKSGGQFQGQRGGLATANAQAGHAAPEGPWWRKAPSSVTMMRAPEAPMGWPSAQAPPCTLTFS